MSNDDKKRDLITNRKRLHSLENIVENHTRTERHLANFGSFVDDEEYQSISEKQQNREENIKTIEDAIIKDTHW